MAMNNENNEQNELEQENQEQQVNEAKKPTMTQRRTRTTANKKQEPQVQPISEEELQRRLLYSSPKDLYYTKDLIEQYRISEAVANHPIGKEHYSRRSKLAYKELLSSSLHTTKYLLPGYPVLFEYLEPKYKEELEYYDRTPFVVMFAITKLPSGVIREVGVNLHYFPPQVRVKALSAVFEVFKDYYAKYFNEAPNKPNMYISWNVVRALMRNSKVGFAVKMYIPVLRSKTYILPAKMLATACYTEGHFSKATARMIYQFWRHFKR